MTTNTDTTQETTNTSEETQIEEQEVRVLSAELVPERTSDQVDELIKQLGDAQNKFHEIAPTSAVAALAHAFRYNDDYSKLYDCYHTLKPNYKAPFAEWVELYSNAKLVNKMSGEEIVGKTFRKNKNKDAYAYDFVEAMSNSFLDIKTLTQQQVQKMIDAGNIRSRVMRIIKDIENLEQVAPDDSEANRVIDPSSKDEVSSYKDELLSLSFVADAA